MQENELERLVREAVAETFAQLEREGRWIAEGTLAVGVIGYLVLLFYEEGAAELAKW